MTESKKPVLPNPFRRKNFRLRVLLPAALGLAVVAMAEPSRTTVSVGLPVILAGVALRVWAAGHLVKTQELCVSGPYLHLRNPLYAGTLAISCGFMLLAGARVAAFTLPVFLAVFFGYYYPRKERVETARLEERFGEPYRAYRAAVGGLLPSLRPWPGPAAATGAQRWQIERFRENSELGVWVAVALALAALSLRAL